MVTSLTKRQREILDFINEFVAKNGYSPSIREIGRRFELSSPATAYVHVDKLRKKGFLSNSLNEPRSLELVKKGVDFAEAVELPLAGLITAGEPIEAIQDNETIAIPTDFVIDSENTYVLKVEGESMIEDGILSGDYVVVENNPSPGNGDVVVALLNDNYATLKKFYKESGRIKLQPANSRMEAIFPDDLKIQGVVRGVLRKFT